MSTDDPRLSRLGLLLVALLTLFWGFNWPIMKIVLRDVPPLTFRGVCLLLGGGGILLIARLFRHDLRLPRAYWLQLTWLSLTNIVAWNVLIVYGLSLMPSGRAALLAYTMPLWSTMLASWLLRETLSRRTLAALALGLVGVALLLGADVMHFGNALLGVLLTVGAAVSWALGSVLLKRFAVPVSTMSLTGWMMISGGLPIAFAAVVLEPAAWRPLAVGSTLGVLYNAFVTFMFCYWAWNRVVLMVPIAVSSLSSLVTPVVGILAGMWLLAERPSLRDVAAAVLILGAVALTLLPTLSGASNSRARPSGTTPARR
jgi:drug/metabolite transporter (DMT)-like permease